MKNVLIVTFLAGIVEHRETVHMTRNLLSNQFSHLMVVYFQ